MTVIMKVDLVGPKSRGLAVGLNEFAGYLSVGVTAFLTGYIAQRYGLRPQPFYLGIGYAVLGLAFDLLVRDTRAMSRSSRPATPPRRRWASGRSSAAPRSATATCSPPRKPAWSIISTTA